MRTPTGPVLLTGCSSGIGHAAAAYLLKAGHTVYATARRPETLDDLREAGARVLALDVTSEDSMQEAVRTVEAQHGRVGVLVNNAGYGVYGTIEEAPLEDVRAMFETNVMGLSRMCQLVLPGMRAAGAGRIINIGSIGGRMTFPVGGYYHATKYAVEAISDALRNEVREHGIDVVLVEPGMIRTRFEETITGSRALQPEHVSSSPYRRLLERAVRTQSQGYADRRLAAEPDSVARVILTAVESPQPRARYLTTPAGKALVQARRLGGDRAWDRIIGSQFGTGR